MIVPKPNTVVVPSTDPALGSCSVGVGDGRVVPVVVEGVGVLSHKQFALSGQSVLRHKPAEHIIPDAQSPLETQPLLHPFGGVGDGVGHKQLVDPVHNGLRQNPDWPGATPEHTNPD